MIKDVWDQTLLHYACTSGHAHIVQFLLSTGKVDPVAKDKSGNNPVEYAIEMGNYGLLKLFRYYSKFILNFPVHTYTKLVLTGYSGADWKTTISQVIQKLSAMLKQPLLL